MTLSVDQGCLMGKRRCLAVWTPSPCAAMPTTTVTRIIITIIVMLEVVNPTAAMIMIVIDKSVLTLKP